MANFERIFEDFFDSVNSQTTSVAVAKSASMEAMDSYPVMESLQSLPAGPQEEFLLQTQIRPHFGKPGINDSPIGTHPDFIALEGTAMTQSLYMHSICRSQGLNKTLTPLSFRFCV